MKKYFLHHGDCLAVMPTLAPDSIDSIVTDPPYGLSFMGKDWDHGVPGVPFWTEALRVAKPGAYLLAFGGSRTYHRLACAIEDAGWEVRDCIMWLYGSGFPKSHNLKGEHKGWGTALKPAWEPIIVARKPLIGTVAENVLRYGTGAINVDGCRVELANGEDISIERNDAVPLDTAKMGWGFKAVCRGNQGRWPANLIHDGSDEVLAGFPVTTSSVRKPSGKDDRGIPGFVMRRLDSNKRGHADTGSAARFFYCAKASRKEREMGCEGMEARDNVGTRYTTMAGDGRENPAVKPVSARNHHPTVKPLALMRYLCRLVTPTGGTVLDPFTGSGSTGKAAIAEGFRFVGIEQEEAYVAIARARIETAKVLSGPEDEDEEEGEELPQNA